jgi:radical SAM protein with 4Fe4S-binding SPASM domain
MDAKNYIKNKSFCPLPWTGFIVHQNGDVRNCVLSKSKIGNLKDNSIQEIVSGEKNNAIKKQMLSDTKPKNCVGCYQLEENKNSFDIISQRIYYLKELKSVDPTLYDSVNNFNLHTVDLRWTNQCNQACVYCGPHNSSMWAKEIGGEDLMDQEKKQQLKEYVFANVKNLKNVYLAGGEPLLMNENREFLELLMKENPNVTLRVNTNLSAIETKVGQLIKEFKNVHWIVSVESTGTAYDYIRYGGSWNTFCNNLKELKKTTDHKISFNMLYFVLNYIKLFDCVDFLRGAGFHENSFVIGPLYGPEYLNILNLPQEKIDQAKKILENRIQSNPGYFLQDSYSNLLKYLDTPYEKNLQSTLDGLTKLDTRRKLDSKKIFGEVYD